MTRFLLVLVVIALVMRAVWRLVVGIAEGAAAPGGKRAGRGVPMVRDPVCGTFVLASRALSAQIGEHVEFFCSEQCLQKRKANPSSGPTS